MTNKWKNMGNEQLKENPHDCPNCGGELSETIPEWTGPTEGVITTTCRGCDWIGYYNFVVTDGGGM